MLALYFSGVSEEGTQRNETTVWRYDSTADVGDAALKQFQVEKKEHASSSVLRVSKAGQVAPFDESETQGLNGVTECEPVCVLPREAEEREAPRLLRTPARFRLASCISSIQLIGRPDASQGAALITTTGSAAGRPSVFILSLAEEPYMVTRRSLQGDVSSECPIWTADCDRSGSRAAIGTNLGAGLVDLETEAGSYFLPSESHVLVLQFHQSVKLS
uniref:Uncharacterized protein n=1 Tax=Brassica campestris TaxID=3711 RepID=M4CQB6_BRACM